jgi:hypothetical protein
MHPYPFTEHAFHLANRSCITERDTPSNGSPRTARRPRHDENVAAGAHRRDYPARASVNPAKRASHAPHDATAARYRSPRRSERDVTRAPEARIGR